MREKKIHLGFNKEGGVSPHGTKIYYSSPYNPYPARFSL